MASLRAALLLVLLPPFSVAVAVAARCLCRVMARRLSALARSQLACLPSVGGGGGGQLPVALYYSRRRRTSVVVCMFCLSGIEEGSEVRELRCRHLFHRACLDRWAWVRARPVAATCPLCRGRLLEDDDDEEEEAVVEEEEEEEEAAACRWLWPS